MCIIVFPIQSFCNGSSRQQEKTCACPIGTHVVGMVVDGGNYSLYPRFSATVNGCDQTFYTGVLTRNLMGNMIGCNLHFNVGTFATFSVCLKSSHSGSIPLLGYDIALSCLNHGIPLVAPCMVALTVDLGLRVNI